MCSSILGLTTSSAPPGLSLGAVIPSTALFLFCFSHTMAYHDMPNFPPALLLQSLTLSLIIVSKNLLQPMLRFMTSFVIDMHICPLHIR